jgi:hypothetical protein
MRSVNVLIVILSVVMLNVDIPGVVVPVHDVISLRTGKKGNNDLTDGFAEVNRVLQFFA